MEEGLARKLLHVGAGVREIFSLYNQTEHSVRLEVGQKSCCSRKVLPKQGSVAEVMGQEEK